jgi:hypothetical protein
MIHSFKIFQKKTSETKSWWLVRWSFRARKNARFVEKKILLKQHEQRRQRVRRHLFDLSSNQARETQIARHAAIALYFWKIEIRLNDELHHRFVILEAQRNCIRFDVDDDRSLYQIQFVHFIKKNVKCWRFDERINRWNLYQIRKIRLHRHKSRFFLCFQILIVALLSFMNTFTIQHRLSFANRRANRKTESNFRIVFEKLCQLSTKWLNQMIQHNWICLWWRGD